MGHVHAGRKSFKIIAAVFFMFFLKIVFDLFCFVFVSPRVFDLHKISKIFANMQKKL